MKHRFLYFCSVWPEWTSSAAGLRSMHMIQMALDSEWEVFVVAPSEKNKFSETIESLGVKVAPVYPNDPALEQVLAEFNPTIVMYDRFISEEKFSFRVREVTPRALQVIETQDFHWLRKIRIQNHHTHQEVIQFPEKEIANQTLDDHACREISSYYRVDFIVVCSLYEKKILLDNFQFPEERIFYVPLLYHQKKMPKKIKGYSERKNFVSIGNFRHIPNQDAMRYMLQVQWPILSQKVPDAELHLLGAYPSKEFSDLIKDQKKVKLVGWVEDQFESLERYRVLLAPLRVGAGAKGKIMDSFFVGTPVSSTQIGWEGLPWLEDEKEKLGDGSLTGCTQLATALYQDEKKFLEFQKLGLQLVSRCFFEEWGGALRNKMLQEWEQLQKSRIKNRIRDLLWYHKNRSTEYFSRWIEEKEKKS